MIKPYLLVVTGRPGSGKTTFSKKLSSELYLPLISRDEIKEGYVNTFQKRHSELPDDTNKVVTDIFFATVKNLLDSNVSLIAEAAFQHKVWESKLEALKSKAKIFMLICKVEDEIAQKRYISRGLDNPMREYFHGDEGVDLTRKGYKAEVKPYGEPRLDVPTFFIDTTNDYSPSIDELRLKIFKLTQE